MLRRHCGQEAASGRNSAWPLTALATILSPSVTPAFGADAGQIARGRELFTHIWRLASPKFARLRTEEKHQLLSFLQSLHAPKSPHATALSSALKESSPKGTIQQ